MYLLILIFEYISSHNDLNVEQMLKINDQKKSVGLNI